MKGKVMTRLTFIIKIEKKAAVCKFGIIDFHKRKAMSIDCMVATANPSSHPC